MASNVATPFSSSCVRPSVASRRIPPPPKAAGSSWWNPLFGWPSEPDYIPDREDAATTEEMRPRRFAGLTEEKARELRMRTAETETFHGAMYHSAIASRLAADLPSRSSKIRRA